MSEDHAAGAPRVEFVNASRGVSAQKENCALCSAAGAVNLTIGSSRYSSNDVASLTGVATAGAFAAVAGHEEAIIAFVEAKTQPSRTAASIVETGTPLADAIDAMLAQPIGTVFVLHLSGKTVASVDDPNTNSHWLNAILVENGGAGELRYFDFQTNRKLPNAERSRFLRSWVGGANPSSSLAPFIGIVGQAELSFEKRRLGGIGQELDEGAHRTMHAAHQAGTFLPETTTAQTILAFPPAG